MIVGFGYGKRIDPAALVVLPTSQKIEQLGIELFYRWGLYRCCFRNPDRQTDQEYQSRPTRLWPYHQPANRKIRDPRTIQDSPAIASIRDLPTARASG